MSRPLRKQLQNPVFRRWMTINPQWYHPAIPTHGNWRVYVQPKKKGPWGKVKKDFRKYSEAYKWMMANLHKYHDIAISSKMPQFMPPQEAYQVVVLKKVKGRTRRVRVTRYRSVLPDAPSNHHWCSFCRRMTKFAYYKKHHAMPSWVLGLEKHCEICGAGLNLAVTPRRTWITLGVK